jgi:signal transduction histidine kinase
MRSWLGGKTGGFLAFVLISGLVVGGLGWATVAALRLEGEQLLARREAEQQTNLRLALWRLDSLVAPVLAKEDSRPYNHYSAVFTPPVAIQPDGSPSPAGALIEPSPLLNSELPDWMLLHFQVDRESGWRSPQVLAEDLAQRLRRLSAHVSLGNVTAERAAVLADLSRNVRADVVLALAAERRTRPALEDITVLAGNNAGNSLPSQQPIGNSSNPMPQGRDGQMAQMQSQSLDKEYGVRLNRAYDPKRSQTKSSNDSSEVVRDNLCRNGADWFEPGKGKRHGEQVAVTLGPMVAFWMPGDNQTARLFFARHVQIGQREICQGVLLDWPRLQTVLAEEATKEDLFPEAQVLPVHEEVPTHSERAMTFLPLQLDPGPSAVAMTSLGLTPLRVGLIFAWAAALVALLAVGLGGWSLFNLSESRIRFVSAVTHELRTPLTTLRLYLDMLAGGMVKEARQKEEYLQTLNTEADRLNRLVGNVLDFSRLEKQRPRLARTEVALGTLLEQVHATWLGRCQSADKELVVDNGVGEVKLTTDVHMVQQILGNLIDNACKYSRGAADRRIWLRAGVENKRVRFEVEDRGPGVPPRERHSIFRAFRRGRTADTTGGVGLGLALAQRWAKLLSGRVSLHPSRNGQGACFQLELPA